MGENSKALDENSFSTANKDVGSLRAVILYNRGYSLATPSATWIPPPQPALPSFSKYCSESNEGTNRRTTGITQFQSISHPQLRGGFDFSMPSLRPPIIDSKFDDDPEHVFERSLPRGKGPPSSYPPPLSYPYPSSHQD
eukprot:356744-Amorphochlora_amoeboformis.AAC.2